MDEGRGGEDDGPDAEFLRRMTAPDNEVPVALPLNTLLARTDDVAIALLGLQVHTTGLTFDVALRARGAFPDLDLHGLLFEHGPVSPGRLLVGVEFSDGRRASNVPASRPGPESDVVFMVGGGSGGDRSVDQSWWLNPLPPAGPLSFVVSCLALGLEETTTVIDGSVIQQAASDVVTLWPWTPPDRGEWRPPPPDVPDGSWFSRRR